ncbi:chaperone protein dnaJ C76, chloroplastic [Silene latifolia]|uniref:chaperone protein dnaJ C76, chloroplastic n=1 Tax=Silene latifolia TaxID=37657 RepID=UPI003D7843DA
MASSNLALHFPTLTPPISRPQTFFHNYSTKTLKFPPPHHQKNSTTCRASSSSSSSSFIREYDLYELMGIESSSDQSEIKKAYRSLQKRCHPDIAGPAGHDMAIILNDAYALLSDPIARFAYDKEQAKMTDLQGYTGQPLYSSWMGSETEDRAVFVDEVKCIGCLKCALFAKQTFAIEAAYGRARVVAQWADPEDKIQASIDVCPVDCISMVERSDLAALEFLMSKQPRGNVRIGASNTAGARSFDVFSEVKVFHKRLDEAATRKSNQESPYSKVQSDARISAIQAIRSISNWLYWQSPISQTPSNLAFRGGKGFNHPDVEKLREAATEARKHGMFQTRDTNRLLPQTTLKDDYWAPSTPTPVQPLGKNTTKSDTILHSPTSEDGKTHKETYIKRRNYPRRPVITVLPVGLAVLASINAILHGAGAGVVELQQHAGGPFALQVVNSSWLQVVLAGVPWYLVGIVIERFVDGLSGRNKM